MTRLLINAGILALLIWAGINSGSAGLSRLFSEYSAASNSLVACDRALDYNSNDAEAHYIKAIHLSESEQLTDAIAELESATRLRPEDYFLWQELGRLREENGDSEGAIIALEKATSLAPHYAQPHWQLGNALLRNDRLTAAFKELRVAAASDPDLFPSLMDLAFGIYEGEPIETAKAVDVRNDHERSFLFDFFLKHDCRDVAVGMLSSFTNLSNDDRKLIVSSLLNAEEFSLAYRFWLNGRALDNQLYDGDFESPIGADDKFGWQATRLTQTLKLVLDTDRPLQGNRSLRIDYAGNFEEHVPVLSQLIPVEANVRYQVSFDSRSENLFSAGLPVVVVNTINDDNALGESTPLSSGTRALTSTSFEFQTGDSTKAIKLNLQRSPCNVKPCPITGKLWLDSFHLEKLK